MIEVRQDNLVTADVECILRSVGSGMEPLTAIGREVGAGAVITPAGDLSASFIVHVALQSYEEPVSAGGLRKAAGFVVAAIAARFVFPGMSLEGRMMWLLRSSPLDIRTLFLAKYWVGTIPLLLIALPLIVVTNILLQASPLILGITTVSMVGVTFAVTALALGLGAIFPNLETDNMAEIPTSFGGLIFMMSAVSYLAVVVILLAWPVNGFLWARLSG